MGLIDPELAAFLEGDPAIFVGTATADGRPDATRGWGLMVGADGGSVRVHVAAGARAALRNLEVNDRVAVTCTDAQTYRSVQLKGRVADVTDPVAIDDDDVWSGYLQRFIRAGDAIGVAEPLVRNMLPPACVTIGITVAELYNQTPGPGAGRPVTLADQA